MSVPEDVLSPTYVDHAVSSKKKKGVRWIACMGLLLGLIIALPPLVNALQAIFPSLPEFFLSLSEQGASFNLAVAVPMMIILILSAFSGVPLFVVLGGIAYMLFARTGQPLEIIPNEAYSMLLGHAIPAIPLFTFAGFILSESKAGERLVRLFRAVFAWFPGGLAVMAILVSAFFTTFTGASGVNCSVIRNSQAANMLLITRQQFSCIAVFINLVNFCILSCCH